MNTHMALDPDEDMFIVQGQLHFYRLFRATGKIERVTDKKELELNWEAIPDQVRTMLHRECDSEEQLGLRASMLMYDSLNGDYFRIKK